MTLFEYNQTNANYILFFKCLDSNITIHLCGRYTNDKGSYERNNEAEEIPYIKIRDQ